MKKRCFRLWTQANLPEKPRRYVLISTYIFYWKYAIVSPLAFYCKAHPTRKLRKGRPNGLDLYPPLGGGVKSHRLSNESIIFMVILLSLLKHRTAVYGGITNE